MPHLNSWQARAIALMSASITTMWMRTIGHGFVKMIDSNIGIAPVHYYEIGVCVVPSSNCVKVTDFGASQPRGYSSKRGLPLI